MKEEKSLDKEYIINVSQGVFYEYMPDILKSLRFVFGYSQAEVAKKIGCSSPTYLAMENGSHFQVLYIYRIGRLYNQAFKKVSNGGKKFDMGSLFPSLDASEEEIRQTSELFKKRLSKLKEDIKEGILNGFGAK